MQNVDDVLAHAQDLIRDLGPIYRETLGARDPGRKLKPVVGDILSAQRKALDFLATGVYAAYGDGTARRVYYPLARTDEGFPKRIRENMPGVHANRRDVSDAIRRHQPYRADCEWLAWLEALRNPGTHVDLTPVTPEVVTHYEIAGGLTMTAPPEARIDHPLLGKNLSIEELLKGAAYETHPTWRDWTLAKVGKPAMQTLEAIQRGVEDAVTDICTVAGL